MAYQPGTHLIATLYTEQPESLKRSQFLKEQLDAIILQYNLNKLGEVYHDFSPGGFTAVICLSESHISLHTWPEFQLVNLDIYLSNFNRTNDGTVHEIFEFLKDWFKAEVRSFQTIIR